MTVFLKSLFWYSYLPAISQGLLKECNEVSCLANNNKYEEGNEKLDKFSWGTL